RISLLYILLESPYSAPRRRIEIWRCRIFNNCLTSDGLTNQFRGGIVKRARRNGRIESVRPRLADIARAPATTRIMHFVRPVRWENSDHPVLSCRGPHVLRSRIGRDGTVIINQDRQRERSEEVNIW